MLLRWEAVFIPIMVRTSSLLLDCQTDSFLSRSAPQHHKALDSIDVGHSIGILNDTLYVEHFCREFPLENFIYFLLTFLPFLFVFSR